LVITERFVEPRLGAYRGETPADSGGDVSAEEARGLRLALYALVAGIVVIALLTFPSGAPLRNPKTGAIVGDSPFMSSLIVLIMLVFWRSAPPMASAPRRSPVWSTASTPSPRRSPGSAGSSFCCS
jgi:p-aminobenzoyl-glutamate transporter AbgT